MSDKNLVSFNTTKTYTGNELYNVQFNKHFFTIMTTASAFCVGFLLSQFLIKLIKYLIPNNKYYDIILISTIFIVLIIFLLLSTIIFTMNALIQEKTNTIIK